MGMITVIPAKKQTGNTVSPQETKKLRVAAYCRVSTDTDEQAGSYEAQITHYTEYISKNPEWESAGIFADDGISATSTKNRTEFNRMIDECMAGHIDMVITKSISRFARNTVDCLNYIRKLKDKNIPIFFEKENINTMDSSGEIMITIMASLAQQESQSLSQNTKMGYQYRFQQGKVILNCTRFLGYDKDENGNLVINPEQAELVRRIFREYLEGASFRRIAEAFTAEGIPTVGGGKKWNDNTIRSILTNEKYMGDALLQKSVTVDFLKKKRVANTGIAPQYYVEDDHEAIIPKDIFMQVQEEMVRRNSGHIHPNGQRKGYSSAHAFSQIIFCAGCGEIYRRVHWNNRGKKSVVWRCITRLSKSEKTCTGRTVKESVLEDAFLQAVNQMLSGRTRYLNILKKNIALILKQQTSGSPETDERLAELQKQLIEQANSRKEYDRIADEILKLREQHQQALTDETAAKRRIDRIGELQKFIEAQPKKLTVFDEKLARRLTEQVVVYDDHLEFTFKSGVVMEINI